MIPQVKSLVGTYLIDISNFRQDTSENTDLIVLRSHQDLRIAARVRRPPQDANGINYAERYPYDFTIRAKRESGAKTELSKVIDGWGDWMFYSHCNQDNKIFLWWLLDLKSFRAGLIRRGKKLLDINRMKPNKDGKTHFMPFDVREFSRHPPLVIGSSGLVI
jgi:hypothetical protein